MLKFIDISSLSDFEKSGYFVANYDKINIEFPTDRMLSFEFPAALQLMDFYIQSVTYNENTGVISYATIQQVDNIYKHTGYFDGYDYATDLTKGIYRIIARTAIDPEPLYKTDTLINVIKEDGINIKFTVNNFNEEIILKESRLVPDMNFSYDFETNFNGKSFKIQSVYYDSYKISLYATENIYQRLQKITNAGNITIIDDGVTYVCKFIDFKEEFAVNELRKIEIYVYDINSQRTEVIVNNQSGTLSIEIPGEDPVYRINLPFIHNTTFTKSVIDEFTKQIKDYAKTRKEVSLRFFLNSNVVHTFLTYIASVGNYSINYKLAFNDIENGISVTGIPDYDIQVIPFGVSMQQIDLTLITETNIKTLWT